jgi:hypothetical protein
MRFPAPSRLSLSAAGQSLLFAGLLGGIAACKHSSTSCWNLPIAEGLIGQSDYTSSTANPDGVDSSHISGPRGSVAINSTDLYVVDTLNSRILGYTSIPSGIAGAAGFELGQGDDTGTDFSDDSTNGGDYGLANPSKVSIATVDSTTYFVVADTANNRVLIWTAPPTANTEAAVVIGQADFTSDSPNQGNSAPTAATLSNPTSAMIANGKLFVVDQNNNRVLIWNSIPTANDTAADLVLGQSSFTTATAGIDVYSSTALTYTMEMNQPSDLWTDGRGNTFIADSGNNRVLYYSEVPTADNPQATYVIGQTAFGQDSSGSGQEHFDAPWGVFSDGSNLYVGDTGNNRVLEFSLSSLQTGADADYVFGQEDFAHTSWNDSDQNGEPGNQQNNQTNTDPTDTVMHSPKGVYATSGGSLYVADSGNNRVLEFASDSGVNGTDTGLCN